MKVGTKLHAEVIVEIVLNVADSEEAKKQSNQKKLWLPQMMISKA